MTKRKRTDNNMTKRKRTDNNMTNRKRTDNGPQILNRKQQIQKFEFTKNFY